MRVLGNGGKLDSGIRTAVFESPVRGAGECELARTLRFRDYAYSFSLAMWHTGLFDSRGSERMGYRVRCLRSRDTSFKGDRVFQPGQVIFQGEDFHGSPLHASDSDRTLGSLVGFLSLRPGDTDAEYFESYTDLQLAFADCFGEELSLISSELEESD